MSDKTKAAINYGIMYLGIISIIGSVLLNMIFN